MGKTFKFEYDGSHYYNDNIGQLCRARLAEFVDVPEDTIWVTVRRRPTVNSLRVVLADMKYDNVVVDGDSTMVYAAVDQFLWANFEPGQVIYVEFEYEETS